MIELHSWPTPNGLKISIFLAEAELEHRVIPVNIGTGAQFAPDFLAIAPNNRIPAIIDTAPADGGPPVSVFESGAILLYLAEKTGRFLPSALRARETVLEWLFWQVGGLGPMLGQNHHFNRYAPEPVPYAVERYVNETRRLYGVLDRQLAGRDYIAGDYSIADMACYPWTVPHEVQQMSLGDFPNVARWFAAMAARPAVVRAYAEKDSLYPRPEQVMSEEARRILFRQGSKDN